MSNPLFGNPNSYGQQPDGSTPPVGYPQQNGNPPQNPNRGYPPIQQAPHGYPQYQAPAGLPPRPQQGQNPNSGPPPQQGNGYPQQAQNPNFGAPQQGNGYPQQGQNPNYGPPQQGNGYPQQGQNPNYGPPQQGNGYQNQEGFNGNSLKNGGWSTKKKLIVIGSAVAGAMVILVVGLFIIMAIVTSLSSNDSNKNPVAYPNTTNGPTVTEPTVTEPTIAATAEQDAGFRLSLEMLDDKTLTFEESRALAFESCSVMASEFPSEGIIEIISAGDLGIPDDPLYERSFVVGAGVSVYCPEYAEELQQLATGY